MNEIADQIGEITQPPVDQPAVKTIWDELDTWGATLCNWQFYIISHAVRDGVLSDEKVNEAYRLYLREKKLDDGTSELPEVPKTVSGRTLTVGSPLILTAMRSLKNVNAIPEDAHITFGPKLTIIYGHNGAGKSGFARVLSCACFSRSSSRIFHNIYDEQACEAAATAQFVIHRGDSLDVPIEFTDGDEHDDLKRVSVFDSSVAQVHLTKENALGFQPAGFDVFDEAIRVLGLISGKLIADADAKTRPNKFGQLFADPGIVAEKIASLTHKSDVSDLRTLAIFGDDEQLRLDEVGRQEHDLLAKSPTEMIRGLTAAMTDIANLQTKVASFAGKLGEPSCNTARSLMARQKTALLDAVKAGAETVSHPALSRTGSSDWDNFVLASRTLGKSERETYPSEGDPCLLCHRPLDEPSAALISRMWGYLDHDARAAAVRADGQIEQYVGLLRQLECSLLPVESRARADLAKVDPGLVAEMDTLAATLASRRASIILALEKGDPDQLPSADLTLPLNSLTEATSKIATQLSALQDGKFQDLLNQLKAEHITLRQRQVLSKNIDDVAQYISDLAWIDGAQRAKPSPRFITDRQKILFEKLIEGNYKDRLANECELLLCSLPVEFKARGSSGKTLRNLKAKGGRKPEDIFSEGEQRALSLADFLTEVNLNPSSAAIVLDDPVTSLDHMRKRAIAKRLAQEALVRQVIVFTHDLVFLTMLSDMADQIDCETMGHWVQCLEGIPGCVAIEETPANSKSYRKTTKAKACLASAKSSSGNERADFIKAGAGALRRTIEVIVELDFLKGAVQRWDEQIRLGALSRINWSNDIADEIVSLQDETSRFLEGHSNSDEFTGGMPEVDDLEKLIIRVDAFIKNVKPERT